MHLLSGRRQLAFEPGALRGRGGEERRETGGVHPNGRGLGDEPVELLEFGGPLLVRGDELAEKSDRRVGHDGVTLYASNTLSMLRSEFRRARSDFRSPISATYQFLAI